MDNIKEYIRKKAEGKIDLKYATFDQFLSERAKIRYAYKTIKFTLSPAIVRKLG
jgi:hypothetical protein